MDRSIYLSRKTILDLLRGGDTEDIQSGRQSFPVARAPVSDSISSASSRTRCAPAGAWIDRPHHAACRNSPPPRTRTSWYCQYVHI